MSVELVEHDLSGGPVGPFADGTLVHLPPIAVLGDIEARDESTWGRGRGGRGHRNLLFSVLGLLGKICR